MSDDSHRDQEPEFVPSDDRVIGRAFRASLKVLAALVVIAGIAAVIMNLPEKKSEEVRTVIDAPGQRVEQPSEMPAVHFTDISTNAGISFIHNTGATGDKMLPESLGGGVAFFDLEGDGDQDLLFVNGTWWDWDMNDSRQETTAALYRNDTRPGEPVRFTDVTAGSGLDVPIYGMGVAAGDVDNDGDTDLFITCVGANRLFINDGRGRFSDQTTTAGVAGDDAAWSTAATFLDYDNDGLLDLFVANYVQWSREIDFKVNFTIDGTNRAYGPPTDFQGSFCQLYHNLGGGEFQDVSKDSGIQIRNRATGLPSAKALGVSLFDFNSDGFTDLMVANDTVQNLLFINMGDGTFKEQGGISGVAFDANGNTRGAMGIDVARYRNNDDIGIAIGNFANEMTSLYVTQGQPLLYADEAIAEGVGPTSRLSLKFGLFFWDYDLDGWLDLLSVNGHLDEDIVKVQQSQSYRQKALLYWNNKGLGFQQVTEEHAPGDLFEPIVGRGCAYADIDGDGDLDAVFTQIGGAPKLLRNDLDLRARWLRVRLVGTGAGINRDAIGAEVRLTAGGVTQSRFVSPSRSYLSQSEKTLTFGLGKSMAPEKLTINWPGGKSQVITGDQMDLSPGRELVISVPPAQ